MPGHRKNLSTTRIEYADVEKADSPLGEVSLRKYHADTGESGYEIRLNGNFLMATHGKHSETVMAQLARDMLPPGKEQLDILVGGLGAGYTLQAALALKGAMRVVVTEISDKVVAWNREYFAENNGRAVDDPKTTVCVENLSDHAKRNPDSYDMILMDVDNGPGWMAAVENEALYDIDGLWTLANCLKEGGVIAVWSPSANALFWDKLQIVFDACKTVDTTPIGREFQEPGDIIYLGVRRK